MTDAEAAVLEAARRWYVAISEPAGYRHTDRLAAEYALLQVVRAWLSRPDPGP